MFRTHDICRILSILVILVVSMTVVLSGSRLDHGVPGEGLGVQGDGDPASPTSTSTNLTWVRDERYYNLTAEYIADIDWNPDYTLVAVTTCRGELGIIDPDVWPSYTSINFTDAYIYSVDWAPNGSHLAIASVNGSVLILDTADWTVDYMIEFPSVEPLMAVDYSPRGDQLVVGRAGALIVYNTTDWTKNMTRNLGEITHVAWSPTGDYISTGGEDSFLLEAEDLQILEKRGGRETDWSPDGSYYSTAHRTGIVNIVRPQPWRVVMTCYGHDPIGEARDGNWDRTGSYFLTCRTNGQIDVWTTSDWKIMFTASPPVDFVTQVAWGKDPSIFVSGDAEGNVIFYRLSPGNFIDLVGEEVLYANYTAYDFIINPNPIGRLVIPSDVRLTLDPSGANVTLECDLDMGNSGLRVVHDPGGLIDLVRTENDLEWDTANNTASIHFRIIFDWTWPHEDMCDVSITTYRSTFIQFHVIVPDLFRVENDVTFNGTMGALGEWQGELNENDWVRGGETITLSGPVLTYQGTDVYHPIIPLDMFVIDNDGSKNVSTVERAVPINISIAVDTTTDHDEILRLGLVDLPEGATLVSEPGFRVRVDGDVPRFTSMLPSPSIWQSVNTVRASVTVDDRNASGVDEDSLEYSYSVNGSGEFTDWGRSGLSLDVVGGAIDGQVTLHLPDGENNLLIWRVSDRVGNSVTLDPVSIKVDTLNVTFTDPVPQDKGWLHLLEVSCGVTIMDLEGSGIDVSTIQFRISPRNLSGYGDWIDWDEGEQTDARTVITRTDVEFSLSTFNYIQWRAMDIAGNGFTASPHYRVSIDVEPIEFTSFEPGSDEVLRKTSVRCRVGVRDNPGGSGVNLSSIEFRWSLDDGWSEWMSASMKGSAPETTFEIVIDLEDGPSNLVQLRGLDMAGNGPFMSPEHPISIDASPPLFEGFSPDPGEKQAGPRVTVSIRIRDELAGLDVDGTRYRTSPGGHTELDEWSSLEVSGSDDGWTATVELALLPGGGNQVQFKAVDRVGNVAVSDKYFVWVNEPPVAVISNPSSSVTYDDANEVLMDSSGSSDPDSSRLTFSWFLDDVTEPIGAGRSLGHPFESGLVNLTLVVTDEMGATDEATVLMRVVHLEEPEIQEVDSPIPWWLVALFVGLLLVAFGLRWRASRTGMP